MADVTARILLIEPNSGMMAPAPRRRGIMRTKISSFALTVVCLVVACGGGSTGDEGLIQFTPLDCGRTGCSFDSAIAVGGRLSLHLFAAEGASTIGLDMRTSDAGVLSAEGVPDVGGRSTWELTAVAAGSVDLEAIEPGEGDGEDKVVDRLTVTVTAVARVGLENFIGDAVGPGAPGGGFDEVWTVNAAAPVSFRISVFDGADAPAMGLFDYTVTLDPELQDNLIDRDTSKGRLYVSPPAGSWSAEWVGGGSTFRAQIVSE